MAEYLSEGLHAVRERDDFKWSLISATNYQCEYKLYSINQTRSKIPPIRDPRRITSDQLTSHYAWVQSIHKHRHSDNSTADILHQLFIRHSRLHSIDLIKSLNSEGLPSAEAEFGLSKHLRHGMSDGFIEICITVANKQSLRRWYLQSECFAALCFLKNWGKSCLGNFTRRLSVK